MHVTSHTSVQMRTSAEHHFFLDSEFTRTFTARSHLRPTTNSAAPPNPVHRQPPPGQSTLSGHDFDPAEALDETDINRLTNRALSKWPPDLPSRSWAPMARPPRPPTRCPPSSPPRSALTSFKMSTREWPRTSASRTPSARRPATRLLPSLGALVSTDLSTSLARARNEQSWESRGRRTFMKSWDLVAIDRLLAIATSSTSALVWGTSRKMGTQFAKLYNDGKL